MGKAVPIASHPRRLPALDVLRGIAILGTFASNIWLFTAAAIVAGGRGCSGWWASFWQWLPNGKFLGLLTIMFGIGLEIQRQTAVRAGKPWPGKYPIRAALLFADGALNYIFVVTYDVLRIYAVIGLVIAYLLLARERVRWWLTVGFLAVHCALLPIVASMRAADVRIPREGEMTGLRPGDPVGAGYWETVAVSFENFGPGFGLHSEFPLVLFLGLGLFLLGANLYRMGIFGPERRALRYAIMLFGFGIALPIDFLIGITSMVPPQLAVFGRYGSAAGVALALLALVAEYFVRRERPGPVGRPLSCVGRMALSCYLLQNILGVIASRTVLTRPEVAVLDPLLLTGAAFLGVSAVLIAFACLWLRFFPRGPFELLWTWSYRKLARE
ncbi:DUF418 domain-containing protein [Nocardia otitidiscaviarum]|uniref:DUF418 domain-containing protein n=1 Tax=Nocardia otitidiscaviarum TaxID=1823 RepID=UPI00189545EE|nr:DUF418 domain-containing protein [Nocardia otitidiscaviarum]MBF6136682.1 DUF418 domain-containing protein [Nocardia otitidiscaviarum]